MCSPAAAWCGADLGAGYAAPKLGSEVLAQVAYFVFQARFPGVALCSDSFCYQTRGCKWLEPPDMALQ